MKKINKLFTVLLFAALSVISCKNNFSELENEIEYTTEKAYLSFGINESEERMVAPSVLPWEEVASIELTKNGSVLKTWTSAVDSSAYDQMKADTSIVLDAGKYTFAVTLKDKDGDILQTGELKDVEIKAGNNSLNFKTKAWLEGKGRLSVKCYVEDPSTVNTIKVYLNNEEKLSISKDSDNSGLSFQDSPICKGNDFECGNYLIKIEINGKTEITDFIEIQNKRETVYNYYEVEKPAAYPVKFLLDDGKDTPVEFGEGVTIDTYTTGGDLPDPATITNIPNSCEFWGWTCNGEKITKLPENTNGQVIVKARFGMSVTNATDLSESLKNGVRSFKITPKDDYDWENILDEIKGENITVILDLTNISFEDNKISWGYFSEGGEFTPKVTEIVIPASVTKIDGSAFLGCTQLESVTFAEGSGLKTLGGSAFSGCSSLKEIVIPKGVAAFSESTFNGCTSLKKVTFEEGSELKTMWGNEFAGCSSLEEIVIPASVEQIGYNTFDGCTKLKKVTFENNSALKAFEGEVFNGCSALEEISIPANVTDFGKVDGKNKEGSLFKDCKRLKKVTFEGNLITEIPNGTFENCESLEEITIPSSVTKIWAAFTNSKNLKNVIFTSDSKIEYIDSSAFYGCPDALLTIPSDLPTKNTWFADKLKIGGFKFKVIVNGDLYGTNAFCKNNGLVEVEVLKDVQIIGANSFLNCSNLTKVTFEEGSRLTTIDTCTFENCNITEIVIPANVEKIEESAFYECENLEKVTFEEGSRLTTIGYGAFHTCNITEIVIPASVTKIKASAFYYCINLEKVTFEEGSRLTKIDTTAFGDCPNVRLIISSDLATNSNFADMLKSDAYKFKLIVNGNITKKNAFEQNNGIVEIEILKNVTSISQYAFQYCQNLKKVSFEEGSKLKRINNGIFYQCDKLEEIVIPASVTTIGEGACCACRSLKEIVISESITSIEKSAFEGCKSLSKVTFEENSKLKIISDSLFYDCEGLTEIVLPATITTIEQKAFELCYILPSIKIPAAVTSIGEEAFAYCYKLTDIEYLAENPNITIGKDAFKKVPNQ